VPVAVLLPVAAAVTVAAVVGVLAGRVRSHRPVARWHGAPARPGPAVLPSRVLDRYRITYRVDLGHPLGSVRDTEVLSVERPLQSRQVTRSTGGRRRLVEDQTSVLGRLRIGSPGQGPTVLGVPPDLAASDARLDVGLPGLEARGAVIRRERRVVVGRPCQVYRSLTPPQGTVALQGVPPGARDYVDSCIDGAGLILAQVRVTAGAVSSRLLAVRVEERPVFRAPELDVPQPPTVPPERGGGRVVPVDPSVLPPGPTWFLDRPPAGFTLIGHYAVAEPQALGASGTPVGQRHAGFDDVWVRGADLLVLDQGGTQYGGPPFDPDPLGQPAALGPLGIGEGVAGPRLSMVRVRMPSGRYVRLAGTLTVDRLAELGRSLRRVDRPG